MEKLFIKIIIFLFFFPIILFPEEKTESLISLSTIITETHAVLRWDAIRSLGELSLYGRTVVFKPGIPFLLFNYTEKSEFLELKKLSDGEVYFSKKAEDLILKFFLPPAFSNDLLRIKAIVIDPGHGGKDSGAVGNYILNGKTAQLKEKDIVLEVGLELASELKNEYPDKEIILTRSKDEFITLEQRTIIANKIVLKENESIIFVSVHANASLNSKANGYEVWYLPPEYRREVIDDNVKQSEPEDVVPILNTMLEEEITVESILLAQSIQKGLSLVIGDKIDDRGLKEESWFVVRNAKMPAVLVEMGFITNQDEAVILGDSSYLKKISKGIYNGICGFIDHFEKQNSSGE